MVDEAAEPKDVAEMLESLARRIRDASLVEATVEPAALDEEPSLGALDVFTDDDAVTVTVETRNTTPDAVHVSLLGGRLLIGLGDGPLAYRRDLVLPAQVDEEQAVATFRNGILDVVLPIKRR